MGHDNAVKLGVTMNPHVVTQREAKDIIDNASIKSDTHIHTTMDPAALQTIITTTLGQTLRYQAGITEQTVSQQAYPFRKGSTELNQRTGAKDRASDACVNKLRPAPYSGTADGVVDPWIKVVRTLWWNNLLHW